MFRHTYATISTPKKIVRYFLIQTRFIFSVALTKKCAPSEVSTYKISPNWPIKQGGNHCVLNAKRDHVREH